jgi:hypothetical protein
MVCVEEVREAVAQSIVPAGKQPQQRKTEGCRLEPGRGQ